VLEGGRRDEDNTRVYPLQQQGFVAVKTVDGYEKIFGKYREGAEFKFPLKEPIH